MNCPLLCRNAVTDVTHFRLCRFLVREPLGGEPGAPHEPGSAEVEA